MVSQHDKDEAARFVARMDGQGWCAQDEAALQSWLAQDPARHGLLLHTHASWLALSPQEAAQDEAPAVAPCPIWRRRSVLAGLAACAAGVAGASRWLASPTAYATGLGEIRRVPLVDGSVMTINSDTELTVRMAGRAREVAIAQGEAWFEVAKDEARPFVVAAGKVRARAVGTAFSVRLRETGVEVLVTEGVVETWADGDGSLRMRLAAGERAMLNDHALVHYEAGHASSVDRALAWRSGMIDLNGTTLSEAADEFNRYNEKQIIIADPDIAQEQFDGLFRINDPQGFAEAVKASLNVGVTSSDPRIIRITKASE
jgi:transmembrane sensor